MRTTVEAARPAEGSVAPAKVALRDAPPGLFWLLPAFVAALRIAPYLRTLSLDPPPGFAILQLGYVPKDTATYLAFVRQVAEGGGPVLYNPFLTEPQEPRFLLLFHVLLGLVCRVTGAAPSLVLELSRVPLTFLFFGVLWWFLRPILPRQRTRLLAAGLIGFAGGLSWAVRPLASLLPPPLAEELLGSTWELFGWTTFEGLGNPLWIVGFTWCLVVLRPILAPAGPRGASDVAAIAIGFLVLAWTHAYSAIVVACVALAMPIVEWIFTRAIVWRRQALVALGLGPAAALVALVARWQEQDPAYRASSASALGPNDLSVFWVPVTLGAVLVFALRGAQSWVRDGHPYRLALLAWIGTVVWLHSSPLVNGYHFVPYLHLPLAILAATGLEEALLRARDATLWGKTATAGLVLALLPGSLVVTAGALAGVSRENVFPAAHAAIIEDLARRPPGNVLGPVDLGNLVPAFTPHRVWAGHWFLTPDVLARHEHYRKLMAGSGDLAGLIAAQHVRYLVVPRERAGAVAVELGAQVTERASYGGLELLVLGG